MLFRSTRRGLVPQLRRQLLFLPVPRESVSWPRSWCGSRASPLLRTANWTVDQLERGDHSLDKPPCCTPALDSATIKLRYVSSQEALALQRRLRDRCAGATCLRQTSSFDIAVTQQLTNFVDAANVNLRKHRSAGPRSAVPNLGVTCPHFFRCEAPRSYNSPYSRASASHRRRTCGACHARRNSFLMDCQSSPRKLNVIPLSPARKFTPISSFSSATVYARK